MSRWLSKTERERRRREIIRLRVEVGMTEKAIAGRFWISTKGVYNILREVGLTGVKSGRPKRAIPTAAV